MASSASLSVSLATGNVAVGTDIMSSTQFLGQASDSVAAPSFSWTGDSNVGIYRPATDTLGIVTTGKERMRVDANGNVGIGTTAPGYKVQVMGGVNIQDNFIPLENIVTISGGPISRTYVVNGLTVSAKGCGLTGGQHTLAIDSTGAVHSWGYNFYGMLGNNSTTASRIPVNISTFGSLVGRTVVAVAGGNYHTVALDSTGAVHTWGYNQYGQLGNNNTTNSLIPVNISTFGSLLGRTVVAVATGGNHMVALDSTGAVHTWGYNQDGQLGNNTTTQSNIPINVSTFGSLSGRTMVMIAANRSQTFALDNTGAVHSWGYNFYGILGNNASGPGTNSLVPINVSTFGSLSGRTVVAVAAGYEHTHALDSTGAVHSWGYNGYGTLGNGNTTQSAIPVNVSTFGSLSGRTVVAVAAGYEHTHALDSTGAVHSWGYNGYGTLGNGNTTQSAIPVNVSTFGSLSGRTVVAVAAGTEQTLALDNTGAVHTWGRNLYGSLGNNSTTQSAIPVNVSTFGSLSGRTVVAVAAGYEHTLALDSTGAVHTWGYNAYGMLGNNSTTNSLIPINNIGTTINAALGIGLAPAYQLQLSLDSAAKPSSSTWTVSSDERLKTDIEVADYDRCYEIVSSLDLKSYNWNSNIPKLMQSVGSDHHRLGWIAQELEPVFPKAINIVPDLYGLSNVLNVNFDQLYAVQYGALKKLMNKVAILEQHMINKSIN